MPAAHISQDDFEERVLKAATPVLVDFYAQWCPPCKLAAPVLDELADEYKGKVDVFKLDTDENREAAAQYGIMSIPTVILFKNGKEVERKIGFGGKQGYVDLINKVTR